MEIPILTLKEFSMKNKMFGFAVIAAIILTALFALSTAACSKSSGRSSGRGGKTDDIKNADEGILTITGLDEYNGKYLYAMGICSEDDINFWLRTSFPYAEISGGYATTKVWNASDSNTERWYIYNGNSTVEMEVFVVNDTEYPWDDRDLAEGAPAYSRITVTFQNGVARGVFSSLGKPSVSFGGYSDSMPSSPDWGEIAGPTFSFGGKADWITIINTVNGEGRIAYVLPRTETWTEADTPFPKRKNYRINNITCGFFNNNYIAVASGVGINGRNAILPNDFMPTYIKEKSHPGQDDVFPPSDFMIAYSENGVDWKKANCPLPIYSPDTAVCYGIVGGNDRFVMITRDIIMVSTDGGANWKEAERPLKNYYAGYDTTDSVISYEYTFENITFEEGNFNILVRRWLARIGDNGYGWRTDEGNFAYYVSTDGVDWTVGRLNWNDKVW
jgi:hypothetical protein